jgi:hypothetical protein
VGYRQDKNRDSSITGIFVGKNNRRRAILCGFGSPRFLFGFPEIAVMDDDAILRR